MIESAYDRVLERPLTGAAAVREALAAGVRQVLAGVNGHTERRIARVVVPVASANPFAWLRAQPDATKLYWSGRGDAGQVAAAGVADRCRADVPADFEGLRRHLAPLLRACDPGVRYYGGMRFDPAEAPSDAWEVFGAFLFVLPRFELGVREGGPATLACNLVLPRDARRPAEVLRAIEQLRFPVNGMHRTLPMPVSRADRPGPDGWNGAIEWALDAFATTPLDKVVFAREAAFGFSEDLDALALLETLRAATPACFHFCIQPGPGTAFIGASPERLFRRQGRRIETEAVAGTRPRGASRADDARLLEELLKSEKDRREHEYVRVSLREGLAPLAEDVRLDEPAEMKLASGRHLVSRARAELQAGVTSLDVLAALHPTPAVGGYPARAALDAIRRHEPFDRGWYAGPVGWIGPDAAEFAVAIRSGLVGPRRLALYSGAGIVEGSVPESEWDEIECKISDFTKILGKSQ